VAVVRGLRRSSSQTSSPFPDRRVPPLPDRKLVRSGCTRPNQAYLKRKTCCKDFYDFVKESAWWLRIYNVGIMFFRRGAKYRRLARLSEAQWDAEGMAAGFCVKALAARLGVSLPTLERFWLENRREIVGDWLTGLRFHGVFELLKSDVPLVKLAQMLRYSQYTSFRRAFKSRFRVAPAEWRMIYKLRWIMWHVELARRGHVLLPVNHLSGKWTSSFLPDEAKCTLDGAARF
jgi:AraC-like DNA-binding protein